MPPGTTTRAGTLPQIPFAPHRFAFGYHRQTWWNWLIGTAFFSGEIGAGLFLVSLLTRNELGVLVGYLIVMVGKNTAHLLYLGRPARFWRAAMRPDRSWIARGTWSTGVLAVTGFLALFPGVLEPYWQLGAQSKVIIDTLAALSALFIMFYDGFVMKASPSIPFWSTALLPVLCLTYAALGGTTLSLALGELRGEAVPVLLMNAEYLFLVINLLLLGGYLYLMTRRAPAARESVRLLLRGAYAFVFIGVVLLVGLAGTLLFSFVHTWTQWTWMIVLVAACELTGDFALLMVLLKSGVFSPQTAPAYRV
ncbi:MAG: NrfD/PsrC family molybdoenzyme membrane anchor subunit [Acidobacteriota bacterium]